MIVQLVMFCNYTSVALMLHKTFAHVSSAYWHCDFTHTGTRLELTAHVPTVTAVAHIQIMMMQ
eukprot:12108-Heterococcus_DN1.PRE.3